ncbi:hypothetical protein GH733_004460 [Mirounga leonina]|nr:hypothetical protein GH733_004460 [Mirounga leonina]
MASFVAVSTASTEWRSPEDWIPWKTLVSGVGDILGTEDLIVEVTADDAVRFYPWTIDNKYYSADINLCVVPNKFLITAEIAESVQAFVVYFDSTQKSGLDGVSSWLPLAEAWLPEVMILVCDRVCENGKACRRDHDRNQGFSLLSSLAGANHSIGSAETCLSERPRLPAAARTEALLDHRGGASNTTDAQADSIVDPMLDLDIQELASLTTGGGDLENFERLFSKLKEMKDKAATLPHEQRKLHAEKVAKAFWMAIGGDRDEIEGLSSDEEH